jgi:SagB-type dehydrogenase family enzyme
VALFPRPPQPARLGDLLARLRAARVDTLLPARLGDLSTLLAASYAARRRGEVLRRPVPSAGALYPLEAYVVALAVTALETGVYHYDPFRHRLALLGAVSFSSLRDAVLDLGSPDNAAVLVIVTGVFWRSRSSTGRAATASPSWRQGIWYRTCCSLPPISSWAMPIGGFHDVLLDRLVGADGLDEASLYMVALSGVR